MASKRDPQPLEVRKSYERTAMAIGVYHEWMWGDRHVALKRYGELFKVYGALGATVGHKRLSTEVQSVLERDFRTITPRLGLAMAWRNYNSSVITTMPIVQRAKSLIPTPLEGCILESDYDCLKGLSPDDINQLAEWALTTAYRGCQDRGYRVPGRFNPEFWIMRKLPPPVFSHLRPQSVPSTSRLKPLKPHLPVYFPFQAESPQSTKLLPLYLDFVPDMSEQPIFLIRFSRIFEILATLPDDPIRPVSNHFVKFAIDALIDFGPVPRVIPVIPLSAEIPYDEHNPYFDEPATASAHYLFRASSTTVPYHIRNWPSSRDITLQPYPWARTLYFKHIDVYADGNQDPQRIEAPHELGNYRLRHPTLIPWAASADRFHPHVWPSHRRLMTPDLARINIEDLHIDGIGGNIILYP